MSGRDDPRAQDAIDAVVAGRAIPTVPLEEPGDVGALRAAIALRASVIAADSPSVEFVTELGATLQNRQAPAVGSAKLVSRRTAISGAIAAGSAAAVGVIAASSSRHGRPRQAENLVPNDAEWVKVATVGDVSSGAAHGFTARGVVGFVSEHGGEVVAVSGVCTHLGCVLGSNTATGQLDCPCHETSFLTDGTLAAHQLAAAPAPLPRLAVRRRDVDIEVLLPSESHAG